MQFKIQMDPDLGISPKIYNNYSRFIFRRINKDLQRLINKEFLHYKVRESLVINSPIIEWKNSIPEHLNIVQYLQNILELVKINGVWIIRLNDKQRIRGSRTRVSTLVRMLEYGTNTIEPYPLIRLLLSKYENHYKSLVVEYMKERYSL